MVKTKISMLSPVPDITGSCGLFFRHGWCLVFEFLQFFCKLIHWKVDDVIYFNEVSNTCGMKTSIEIYHLLKMSDIPFSLANFSSLPSLFFFSSGPEVVDLESLDSLLGMSSLS